MEEAKMQVEDYSDQEEQYEDLNENEEDSHEYSQNEFNHNYNNENQGNSEYEDDGFQTYQNDEQEEEYESERSNQKYHSVNPSSHGYTPDERMPGGFKLAADLKLRRRIKTVNTDFYSFFEKLFSKNHPYIKVKGDAQKARAILQGIYVKRENINNDIAEEVAVKIIHQENSLLWQELK